MKSVKISACAAAALMAATSAVSAGPMPVARGALVTPVPSDEVIEIHYRRKRHVHRSYRHYGSRTGAAAAAALAGGLLSLGAAAAYGGHCGYYGCYPAYGYGYPAYGYGYMW
jgi:hypothetical protein